MEAIWRPVARRPALRRSLAVALAIGYALALTGGAAWQTCDFAGCPDAARLAAFRPGGAPLLLDRHGQVIATLDRDDLQEVRLASLPAHLPAAFVAIEDRRFLDHGAVDWRRVAGALAADLRAGSFAQGFSTIAMQLARNLYPQEIPGEQRTTSRKLLEIRVAQQLEAHFSKREILELYLNHIAFGNGARGIEAAAWQYFGRPAERLDLAQAALLAALPKAPSRYDPRRHPERALARRNLVLARMAAQGRVAPELAAAAAREPLGVHPPPAHAQQGPQVARYFVDEVRHELEERFGESLYTTPVRVWTTLDLAAQRAAEEELERQLLAIESGKLGRFSRAAAAAGGQTDEDRDLEGAVVSLEAASGDVLAWVGGRDYRTSQFDRVAHARRQAGSAWKPFVYAAALARGYPLSQQIADTPLVVPLAGGGAWEPRNYDGAFDGQVSLREALARSKNVPTVRLAEAVGYDRIAALAAADGITAPVPRQPSMPLGTVAVAPLELTAAYAAFATLGWQVAPRTVLRVERADGTTLWTAPPPARRQVLDPAVAYRLDDALREALIRGSGAPGLPPGFAGRAAGKTGTSTAGNDVWFIGFTTEVVTGVWIGFDEPRPIANQATGGRLAAPVFRRLMSRLYADRQAPAWWQPPAGVASLPIDPATGLALDDGCVPAGGEPPLRELFLAGLGPAPSCPGVGGPTPAVEWNPARPALAANAIADTDTEAGNQRGVPPGVDSPGEPGVGRAGADENQPAARSDAGANASAPMPPRLRWAPAAAAPPVAPGAAAAPGDQADGDDDQPPQAAESAAPPAAGRPRGVAAGQSLPPAPAPAAAPGAGSTAGAAGTSGAAGAAGDIAGWWEVTNRVDPTSLGEDRGLQVTYRIALRQEGTRISGEGERWAVDGRQLLVRAPVDLTGSIDGREVRLRFVERGPRGTVSGTFNWRLAGGASSLAGTFAGGTADSHGASSAIRLR